MDTTALAPETARLWGQLRHEPDLDGFVLVGGTALAMRIQHRQSLDLDLACLGPGLPRARLAELRRKLGRQGFVFVDATDPVAAQEFEISGLDLDEHQQDFIVNDEVKVSFVCLDPSVTAMLVGTLASPVRVATLDEIFATKCWACAQRSKSRDWFDLYILLKEHGYRISDMHGVFQRSRQPRQFELATMRLKECKPHASDEGYQQLTANAPSLQDMADFFSERLAAFQREHSESRFRRKLGAPGKP